MKEDLAEYLLKNLLERAQSTEERTFLTSREIIALSIILGIRGRTSATDAAARSHPSPPLVELPTIPKSDIPPDAILCIDFGTSFSKAFACIDSKGAIPDIIDLPIGQYGGGDQLLLTPSEMLIDDGKIYFGGYARKVFDDSQASVDRLIDSIKQYMTLGADVTNLAKIRVDSDKDPDQKLFQRDILVLYLAHLTRLTEKALEDRGHTANIRRRFTHPAWAGVNKKRNEDEMRQMMAEAIVLSRSFGDSLLNSIPLESARAALDQLKAMKDDLPFDLIAEPVREATAAGAGALMSAAEDRRETYLILDVGAGTTDIAGCYCINNPDWKTARIFEVTSASDAILSAGNVLDNALAMMILEKASIVQGTTEYRAAAAHLRREKRIYKEQLFANGLLLAELPTGEIVEIKEDDFLAYGPVVAFESAIRKLITKSAEALAGDETRIAFVATGGGARLPIIRKIAEDGVHLDGKHIRFSWREPAPEGLGSVYPDLVAPYPQIAVAVGGALPNLPEQRESVRQALKGSPKYEIAPSYKS